MKKRAACPGPRRARITAVCAAGQLVFGALAVPQAASHPADSSVVDGLAARAEELRGLAFRSPVVVQRRIGDDFAGPPSRYLLDEETLGEQTLKRALGFLAADQDLTEARINQIAPNWGAYYDPAARVVVVRAIKRSPPVAATLVHEFVHALQHQHFAFDEVDPPTRDAHLAFSALLEGDAERVEAAYLATRRWPAKYLFPPARGLSAVVDARGSEGVPQLENQELRFPYALGPALVEALLRAGGQHRLDAAFADPPTTTEQVLHPQRYLDGEGARPVSDPAADGPILGSGVLGELRLFLFLSAAIPRDEAEQAANGWGGDRYVAWQEARRSCTRIRFVMDSAPDDRQLLGALNRLVSGETGMTVAWDGTTTLTACR